MKHHAKTGAIALGVLLAITIAQAALIDPGLDAQVSNFGWGLAIVLAQDGRAQDALATATGNGFVALREYDHVPGFSGVITKESYAALTASADVALLELDRLSHVPDPEPISDVQLTTSVISMGATQTRSAYNVSGRGVIVAIIDTGVLYTHADLGGCFGAGCRVADGYDFVNTDGDPTDDHGHGTHVAGIIGANGTLMGVAPNATFYALKACNNAGSCPTSAILSAIDRAITNHTPIISMSLGSWNVPWTGKNSLTTAVENAVRNNITVVVSAGNNGNGQGQSVGTVTSPAFGDNIISVAAVDDQGTAEVSDDNIASFSSRGPGPWGRFVPLLSAPGTNIYSTYFNGGYATMSGTSMAAPHVSGAAALLREALGNITPLEMAQRLTQSATNLSMHPQDEGAGEINVTAAAAIPVVVLAYGNASLQAIVLSNTTAQFNLTLRSLGLAQTVWSVSAESFLSQRLEYELPGSIVGSEGAAVDANGTAALAVNITLGDANGSVYQSVLLLSMNDSQGNNVTIRVPVALSVPVMGRHVWDQSIDNPPRDWDEGDVLWFLSKHERNSSVYVRADWSGDSGSNDLDLYLWDITTGTAASAQSGTNYEATSYADSGVWTWLALHAYDTDTHPRTTTLNLSPDAWPVLGALAVESATDGQYLVVNISATDVDTLSLTYSLNDTNFTDVGSGGFGWNISVGYSGTRYVAVSVSDGRTTVSGNFTLVISSVNHAPTVSGVNIVPALPSAALGALCNYTYADIDSDSESGSIIRWYFAGEVNASMENATVINGSDVRKGVALLCEVVASDGTAYGSAVNASAVVPVNTPPSLNLSISASSVIEGDTVTLNWSVADIDGDAVIVVADEPLGSGSWLTNATGSYVIFVNASDGENVTRRNASFVVVSAVRVQNISLAAGWNLVSLGIAPFNTSVSGMLSGLNYTYVWAFNGSWSYSFGGSGELTDIVPGLGYWLWANNTQTLVVNGSDYGNETVLSSGWNLVGVNALAAPSFLSLQDTLTPNGTVWSHDAGWKSYASSGPAYVNSLDVLTSGRGYWVYMDGDDTWTH